MHISKPNVFLISPVRGCTEEQVGMISRYVGELEKRGLTVHWPLRDTSQKDTSGFWICADNRAALRDADEVHLWWSGDSEGSIFDLGMAFYGKKKLVLANPESFPPPTEFKSFRNVVAGWLSL